uniref:Uncharacterized protein n=1 Tax=Romanomermis culicivorax TaxID=13658 RepID=A0A915K4Z0_ROMCU
MIFHGRCVEGQLRNQFLTLFLQTTSAIMVQRSAILVQLFLYFGQMERIGHGRGAKFDHQQAIALALKANDLGGKWSNKLVNAGGICLLYSALNFPKKFEKLAKFTQSFALEIGVG